MEEQEKKDINQESIEGVTQEIDQKEETQKEDSSNNQFDTLFIVWAPGKKHLVNVINQTVIKTLGCMHVEDKPETFTIQEATRMCLLEGGDLNEEEARNRVNVYIEGQCIVSYYFLIRSLRNNYAEEMDKLKDELQKQHGFEVFKDYHLSSNWNTKQLDQSFLISGLDLGRLITKLLENLKK